MDIVEATKTCFKKTFICHDRGARSEYWWFFLACTLAGVVAGAFDGTFFPTMYHNNAGYGPAGIVYSVATFIPSFTAMIRRLHDTNRSGWWWLISLTIIGLIPLLFWLCVGGTKGENRFGPDPLAQPAASA